MERQRVKGDGQDVPLAVIAEKLPAETAEDQTLAAEERTGVAPSGRCRGSPPCKRGGASETWRRRAGQRTGGRAGRREIGRRSDGRVDPRRARKQRRGKPPQEGRREPGGGDKRRPRTAYRPHRMGEDKAKHLPEAWRSRSIEEPEGEEGAQTARGQRSDTEDKGAGQEARGLVPETATVGDSGTEAWSGGGPRRALGLGD
jgi:hypothetical protein